MSDFLKLIGYILLTVVGLCLIVPLLCVLFGFAGPYFTELGNIIGSNPALTAIATFIFYVIIICLVVKVIQFIADL